MYKVADIFTVPEELIKRNYDDSNPLPNYRSEFMRDRDRIMYATAFRRLAGKTQIYTVGTDDHKKNRLTHTLEVAQIARTIATALGLNPDLSEAIALAHDFGHTPFGHAGEEMLHNIMIPHSSVIKGSPFYQKKESEIKKRFKRENPDETDYLDHAFGFKHNLQSVRVAALLEDSYRGQNGENIGLNLTNFTLYGMMIHSSLKYDWSDQPPNFQNFFKEQMVLRNSDVLAWSFEAYIVSLADDIAQWHHDLEDALREGVLPIEKICSTVSKSLNEALSEADKQSLATVQEATSMDRRHIAQLSHIVVNTLVNDLVENSRKNFAALDNELKSKKICTSKEFFSSFDDLKLSLKKEDIIVFSDKINKTLFKETIKASIHHSRNVERMNEKGKYIIRKLFEAYRAHPQQLPDGPILHLLVDTGAVKYQNVDDAKKDGIGEARVAFDKILDNPPVYFECMLMRRICDHIASMTDHYAIEEYNNLYG